MKNKNERRTFINNKWKVILSNILQRATSYRSIIKSNSVSCSELLRAAPSLQQVTNGCDVDDGPGWSSTRWPLYSLSSLLPAAPESSGNSVSFLFCVCCPFLWFQCFLVLQFQSNKQQKLQIKTKQSIIKWWLMRDAQNHWPDHSCCFMHLQ